MKTVSIPKGSEVVVLVDDNMYFYKSVDADLTGPEGFELPKSMVFDFEENGWEYSSFDIKNSK